MLNTADAECDERLLAALRLYYASRDRGEPVDSEEMLAQFSDVAERLRDFLAGAECVDEHARGGGGGAAATRVLSDGPDARPVAVGDYEIEGELGHGGMGIVYRAYHRPTRRHVALKMMGLERHSTPEHLQRFQIEVQAVAALDHPHIVPIYDVGQFQGRPFFTMKLLDGGTLSQRLGDFQGDPVAAASVVFTIAQALDEAHARGILHRDVKPQNILLDATGRAYLTDFGLAKLRDGNLDLTKSIATVGSPQYMAPEQARGQSRNVTTAVDVYGLGATLYALLTGRPPFESDSLFELLHLIQTAEPQPPVRIDPQVPGDLEVICLKCLRKDRSERYATASELADDLQAFLHGLPIRARPPGQLGRLWLWCRRNRTVSALSALLTLALVAGAAASTVFWRIAESRLVEMTTQRNRAESSYRLSRTALERSVKLIIDDPRLRKGPLEKLRLDVLAAQLEFHEQFVAEHGSNPNHAADLAYSHLTIAHVANEMGEQDRALAHFQQALNIYDQLTRDRDGLQRFGKTLATCWNRVARILYERKRNQDVEAAYSHARRILEQLIETSADDLETTLYLAETLTNLGNLRRDTGRAGEAVELHRQAVDVARRASESSRLTWARGTLAAGLSELGYSCERTIRWDDERLPHWDEAQAAYVEARTLYSELAQAEPENVEWLSGLAYAHSNLASINSVRDPDVAEAECGQGLRKQAGVTAGTSVGRLSPPLTSAVMDARTASPPRDGGAGPMVSHEIASLLPKVSTR